MKKLSPEVELLFNTHLWKFYQVYGGRLEFQNLHCKHDIKRYYVFEFLWYN